MVSIVSGHGLDVVVSIGPLSEAVPFIVLAHEEGGLMSEQRVAVVTGGGSGIGLAISRRLAADGHAVAVLDLSSEAATGAAAAIASAGGRGIGLPVDVGDREQVFAAIDEVRSQLGSIAILVNNAGMGSTFSRFAKITPEFWEQVIRVNLTGTFNCCQAALPDMVEARWGRIVNISSSSAHSGQPLLAPYVSSKSAVNGLTKSLALEVAHARHHRQRHPARVHRHPDAPGLGRAG